MQSENPRIPSPKFFSDIKISDSVKERKIKKRYTTRADFDRIIPDQVESKTKASQNCKDAQTFFAAVLGSIVTILTSIQIALKETNPDTPYKGLSYAILCVSAVATLGSVICLWLRNQVFEADIKALSAMTQIVESKDLRW